MVTVDYVPRRGDLVWLHFDPQTGHEQAGRRPALVLSPRSYNGRVGLAIFCPVTNQAKGGEGGECSWKAAKSAIITPLSYWSG